jgi:hypothetical protein
MSSYNQEDLITLYRLVPVSNAVNGVIIGQVLVNPTFNYDLAEDVAKPAPSTAGNPVLIKMNNKLQVDKIVADSLN